MIIKERRELLFSRLLSKTIIEDRGYVTPCYVWTGATSGEGRGGGYGRISIDGQTSAVHLVAFTHFYGYINGKKQVDHLCKTRACWNPLHLELVTPTENQKRKYKCNASN